MHRQAATHVQPSVPPPSPAPVTRTTHDSEAGGDGDACWCSYSNHMEGGTGGGPVRRTPTDQHPLAAGMGAVADQQDRLGPAAAAAASAADAANGGAASGSESGAAARWDVCAACRFGITGAEPAVRALQGLYHVECFNCAACGVALLPSGAVAATEEREAVSSMDGDGDGPMDAVARELRRVRLGSLDGAELEGGGAPGGEEGGGGLAFLELDGRPLCRRHYRERLQAMEEQQSQQQPQQEQLQAAVPADETTTGDDDGGVGGASSSSPPASAFATPDRPPRQQQDADDGAGYTTAPSSPTVRFAPLTEPMGSSSSSGLLPAVFHSADGLERLRLPLPPGAIDVDDGGGPSPTSAEASPTSRLRRSKSAAALRSGGRGQPLPHQRRRSHAHPLLSVAARETAAERDARLLRRRASQQELLAGAPGALVSPSRGQQQLSPQRPRRPLTTATALAYGVQAVAGGAGGGDGAFGDVEAEAEAEVDLEEGAFTARRQRELLYDVGGVDEGENGGSNSNGSKPVSFFWEEAAPLVFARVRRLFGVAPAAYAAALAALEEEGKVRLRLSAAVVVTSVRPSLTSSTNTHGLHTRAHRTARGARASPAPAFSARRVGRRAARPSS